ncbi:uridine kinase [Sediminispirochaeta smaragdinae]|uniref:Uridine kinase n=1 Tax=Sediminispirochaeta smaragdinae (strain DSM 11293 / JCM 15392 / SEBR 4228) TaxID=573413 RepID=E1R727_SEDSS|nr:uridine kinase [Sediminispirochaeta smaragdinae]ADK81354.1 uridine kinase [Sediminispirochaeta smaragdinae DSM 11293]
MEDIRVIAIGGGSGSGKTTIVRKISEIVPDFNFIPQDNYYKSAEYINNSNITAFNFDHPEAFDNDLLYEHLLALKSGKSIEMPQYDFVHHRRKEETVPLEPKHLIIFEGIMVFSDAKIRSLFDLKLFVDTPDDIRFIRRLERDVKERGRTVDSVINQYLEVVRPGHYEFIEPTKLYADLIIPEGGFNDNALRVLIPFMKEISRTEEEKR